MSSCGQGCWSSLSCSVIQNVTNKNHFLTRTTYDATQSGLDQGIMENIEIFVFLCYLMTTYLSLVTIQTDTS